MLILSSIMYNGLCFTSKIEPIYSPIKPRKRSCIPENKEIKIVRVVHPEGATLFKK